VHTGLYVIMGVAGSGKTTIGARLARALDVGFVEGDALHPAENVRRMAQGIPLTDADRRPWLLSIAARIREARQAGRGLVVACSALRRSYRDLLRAEGAPDLQFVFLRGTRDLIARRMSTRTGHFMPASLLESQFATLEEPSPDEAAWVCDGDAPPDAIVADLIRRIG
jgi:carbohydrate kinase (thermoresistant glucokinase family)